jgi:hypothetical protein
MTGMMFRSVTLEQAEVAQRKGLGLVGQTVLGLLGVLYVFVSVQYLVTGPLV